jgi:hypothetical protein
MIYKLLSDEFDFLSGLEAVDRITVRRDGVRDGWV